MFPFYAVEPEIARRETRVVCPINQPDLPEDQYAFEELYCIERDCDCRRVLLRVISATTRLPVAVINHAFEPGGKFDEEQTFLDPLHRQSRHAPALLELFNKVVLKDPVYQPRLERHYAMVKRAILDPSHPVQHHIKQEDPSSPSAEAMLASLPFQRSGPRVGRNDPCPCGSGKKHKKCCLSRPASPTS